MFGVDWNDPTTLWLNLTNLGLGLLVLGSVAAVCISILMELFAKKRSPVEQSAGQAAGQMDPHLFHTPELGLTMADGGEPLRPGQPAPKSENR